MHKFITAFSIMVGFAVCSRCQQSAEILWARGGSSGGEWLFSSLHYSEYTHTLIANDANQGLSWPIGLISLPFRNNSYGVADAPSVITKGGREILAGGVIAWDLTTNQVSSVCNVPSYVQWLAASADGSLIATSSYPEGILRVYDRQAGKDIITWSNSAGCVSFSPDGRLLLAGSGGSLALIDVAARKTIRRFNNILNFPAPVAFNPVHPGRFVVQDNEFWEMDTSGRILQTLGVGTTTSQGSIAFSPSGNQLAVEVGGGMAVVNLETGVTLSVPGHTLPCFISEDTLATVVGSDLRLISVSNSTVLGSLTNSESYYLSFLADGSTLLDRWNPCDIRTGQTQSFELFSDGYPTRSVLPNSYSLHGSMAAGIENYPQQGICVWEDWSDSGTLLSLVPDSICAAMSVFSPDSSVIAFALHLGCHDADPYLPGYTTLELWSAREQKRLYRLNAPILPANAIIFSQDGSQLATSDGDSCFVWSVSSGKLAGQFGSHSSNPWGVEVMSFLPGDTSLLLRGYEVCSLSGSVLRYMPSNSRAQILRLPNGRYLGGAGDASNLFFLSSTAYQWPDSSVDFFDLEQGKVTNTVTVLEKYCEGGMVVNPATGDFAMGGRDLIYYKSPEPLRSSVQSSPLAAGTLEAHPANGHIEVSLPSEHGSVYVYRSDGRCFYSSQTQAGLAKYTTGPLPTGVYFVVFQSESGERRFAKVSLLE